MTSLSTSHAVTSSTDHLPEVCPPPGSPAWTDAVQNLHTALQRADFYLCQWIPTARRLAAAPLEPRTFWRFVMRQRQQMMESTALPGLYQGLTRLRNPVAVQCLSFFGLERPLPDEKLTLLLDRLPLTLTVQQLLELGIVRRIADGRLQCRLRFVPHCNLIFVADAYDRTIHDFAYLGRDSVRMADWLNFILRGRRFHRGLDICCGTGVQALTLAGVADRVEGVDINPRSVGFAKLNAQLNHLADRVEIAHGNLATDRQGPFDVIASNPPYVFVPDEEALTNRDGFGGGHFGLELVGRIVSDLDRLLGDPGEAHVVLTSPVVNGKSMLEPFVEERLMGTRLGAKVHYLDYRFQSAYLDYHRAHGVRYVIDCYLEISRQLPPGVQTVEIPPIARLLNRAYVECASLVKR